jgi:hypothetical protein
MPTERALVGGGTTYDNTQVSSQYRPYYEFTTSDNTIWNVDIISASAYSIIDGTAKSNSYVNDLFTGVLPYQNPWDSHYKNVTEVATATKKAYFNFGLPVVITKYRMYNSFGENVYGITNSYYGTVSTNMADETPQDWTLSGSNDQINWTTIDTRSSQSRFPYATDRLAKNCSYSEYTVTGASAYKIYRLIITKGGRSTRNTKSGVVELVNGFQIGEIQLWGYESPETSCELHGGYTLFPSLKYLNSSGTILTETAGTAFKTSFPKAFSDFSIRSRKTNEPYLNRIVPTNGTSTVSPFKDYFEGQFFESSWGPFTAGTGVIADTGYLDFGVAVTISSYNMINSNVNSGAWTLYGSSNNSTWTSIDNRTGISNNNSLVNYAISSPASYRYYKMELKNGATFSNKSGTGYTIQVYGLQFMGIIT